MTGRRPSSFPPRRPGRTATAVPVRQPPGRNSKLRYLLRPRTASLPGPDGVRFKLRAAAPAWPSSSRPDPPSPASGEGEWERLARVVHQHCLDIGVAEADPAEHDRDGGEQMVIPQAAVPLEALLEPDVHAEEQLAEVAPCGDDGDG